MRQFHYTATLYASNEGLHDTKDVTGILHSDRTLHEEDVRKHLIDTTGWDDAHDIEVKESVYIQ